VAANSGKYQQQNCQHQEHHSDWLAVYQLLTGALNSLSDEKQMRTPHIYFTAAQLACFFLCTDCFAGNACVCEFFLSACVPM
jgi:hypothetical protein